jgi:hypothetical protein
MQCLFPKTLHPNHQRPGLELCNPISMRGSVLKKNFESFPPQLFNDIYIFSKHYANLLI